MSYVSREDIRTRLSDEVLAELTDENAVAPNWDVVDRAIAFANAEVDSYLGVRFTVPLSTVPLILRERATDIAVYHLYKKRVGEAAVEVPEEVRRAYEEAIAWLEKVRDGKATIAGLDTQGQQVTDSESDRVQGYSRTKVFGDTFEQEY